jgi:hypothetical protein
MPINRTELLYLCTGAIAGFFVAKNFDKFKEKAAPLHEKLGPLIETAAEAARDAYAAAAKRVAERAEEMQDAAATATTPAQE